MFPSSCRPALFALALLTLLAGRAQASAINECIDACFNTAACASNEAQGENAGICESARDRCVKQCDENVSRGTNAPPVTGAFGAIAYDRKSGAWGMADAAQDKGTAEASALAYCKKHGPDCEIVESFSKTCAAVAAGTGNRLAWAVGSDPKQTGLEAIQKCSNSGDNDDKSRCFLQLYHCYFP